MNVADVPPLCDFYFGSVIKRGPLQIMVSTNGKGPRLANRIRRQIEDSLPENVGEAIESIGLLRSQLRKKVPSPAEGKRRMEWMIKVTDRWSLDELCLLDEEMRAKILDGWEDQLVLGYEDVRPDATTWSRRTSSLSHTFPQLSTTQSTLLTGAIGCGIGVIGTIAALRMMRR